MTEFEKRMIAYCDSNHDLCAAMVRELERLNKNLEGSKYVSQSKAAEYLGRSERTLLSMRQNGTLKEGKHWVRKTPTKETSHVLYDLASCEEVLLRSQATTNP